MGKKPHTACHRGKRVELRLRDGSRVRGRFLARTDRHVVLDTARVAVAEIRAFIIWKGQ